MHAFECETTGSNLTEVDGFFRERKSSKVHLPLGGKVSYVLYVKEPLLIYALVSLPLGVGK